MTTNLPPDPAAERPTIRRTPRRGRLINNRVAVVDVLADSLDGFAPDRMDAARRTVHARVLAVRRGHWDAATDATSPGIYAFIIIEGTMLRRVAAGHREGAE